MISKNSLMVKLCPSSSSFCPPGFHSLRFQAERSCCPGNAAVGRGCFALLKVPGAMADLDCGSGFGFPAVLVRVSFAYAVAVQQHVASRGMQFMALRNACGTSWLWQSGVSRL